MIQYLPAVGIILTGWTLREANGRSADGSAIVGTGLHDGHAEAWVAWLGQPRHCGSRDFDHDGLPGTDPDIGAFFACISGTCCATCDSADFNRDGDVATDADIEAFFRVLAGGSC